MNRESLARATLSSWLLACAVLCIVSAPAIAALRFPDPDDAMRLLEVRDWLSGQSWWDVGQHRLNGGEFPMHWSRLVDLPLAVVMMAAEAVGTTTFADRFTMTLVPLVTLLAVMAGVAHLTDRLAGREPAQLALVLTPLTIPLLYQLRPMRIDHHGWQIALAVAAMAALTGSPTTRRGAYAGAALAALITISLEGLPIAATIAGALAMSWVIDPERRHVLRATLLTFAGVALLLHLVTRGPGAFAASCDAISPSWLGALGVAAVGTAVATFLDPRSAWSRLAMLLACGGAAAGTLLIAAPECARGPFASLQPIVRTLWYERVSEGLPLWDQPISWAFITIALPITGIIGSIAALRASAAERALGWQFLLAVLVPVSVLACLVNRCGATANALALPGAASLLLILLTRARAVGRVPLRVLATAGAFMVASPGLIAGAVFARTGTESLSGAGGPISNRAPCDRFEQVRALGQLPAGTVFLPIDVAPDLIATTHHRAIGGGYHRNAAAMSRVLSAFTGTPRDAERIIRASAADYVAGCPDLNETALYNAVSPRGFWARLENGERFAWLEPLRIDGSPVLAWRVVPSK